jgi:hypothetical protein
VALSPAGRLAAILFAGTMLAILGTQLVILRDQRAIALDQRAVADRQLRVLEPLVRQSRPLVRSVRRGLPQVRADARRADQLVRATTPLVGALQDLPLDRVLRSGAVVLEQVRSTRLIPRMLIAARDAHDGVRIARRVFATQRTALELQRQQLAVARRTLVVAEATGRHAASLDRKLGGEVAVPAVRRR